MQGSCDGCIIDGTLVITISSVNQCGPRHCGLDLGFLACMRRSSKGPLMDQTSAYGPCKSMSQVLFCFGVRLFILKEIICNKRI
jgi:hypothetical protein